MDNRYYFDTPSKIENIIILDEKESHHLMHVRRGKIGDKVVCINGDGKDYFGKISNITKKNVTVEIEKVSHSTRQTKKSYTLFLAIAKADAMEESISKATQMGINKIVLFKSEYMPTKFDIKILDKFKNIIIQSSKQCERATFPDISVVNFDELKNELNNYGEIIFASVDSDKKYIANLTAQNIAIIIGNEGGFSVRENESLNSFGARPISLGKTILRAPTAAVSATAIAMQMHGEYE